MDGWQSLTEDEHDGVRNRFEKAFRFRPSAQPEDWPSISEPAPSVTYNVAAAYDARVGQVYLTELSRDLHIKALGVFRRCVRPGQWVYALDWQRKSFRLQPHAFSGEPHQWPVPFGPLGEYTVFLGEDFEFGAFGHPLELTICTFGEPVLKGFERAKPLVFNKVIRRNGKRV